jgi:hypothetical protein
VRAAEAAAIAGKPAEDLVLLGNQLKKAQTRARKLFTRASMRWLLNLYCCADCDGEDNARRIDEYHERRRQQSQWQPLCR